MGQAILNFLIPTLLYLDFSDKAIKVLFWLLFARYLVFQSVNVWVIRAYFEKFGVKVPFTKANLRSCKVFLFHLPFNMVDVQFIKAITVATLQAKW